MTRTNEERISVLESSLDDVRGDIKGIQHDVRDLRDDFAGRPSWPVSILITFLASTCVGLIVALANNI